MNIIKNSVIYNENDLGIKNRYFEHDLFKELIKPDDYVLDIGAHIGIHSLFMSSLVGKNGLVMAFEPQRLLYYNLCANVTLNNITNVFCLNQAIGQTTCPIIAPDLDFNVPDNFGKLAFPLVDGPSTGCAVKLTRLDDIALQKVNFIKINVSGKEIEVLAGASETLKKFKPLLYIANAHCYTPFLISFLHDFGYKIYLYQPEAIPNFICSPNKLSPNNLIERADQVKLNIDHDSIKAQVKNNITENTIKLAESYMSELNMGQAFATLESSIYVTNSWKIYNLAGQVLIKQGLYESAIDYFQRAIFTGKADLKIVGANYIIALINLGRPIEAEQICRHLLNHWPDDAKTHFYLGWSLLSQNKYEEGLKEWEWRIEMPELNDFKRMLHAKEVWNGKQDLKGEKILLLGEQGFGDLIQYVRYADYIKSLGAETYLLCTKEASKLFTNSVDHVVEIGSSGVIGDISKIKYSVSLLSMPYIIRHSISDIPNKCPYIFPVSEKLDVNFGKKFKVGIVWAGNETHKADFTRSIPLSYFKCLEQENVQLFSLQVGPMERTWPDYKINLKNAEVNMIDLSGLLVNYNVTANILKELDLVISVDTSVAHLAGAMGVPVWIVLGFPMDVRWNGLWYPSARLFKRELGQSWKDVMTGVSSELRKLTNKESIVLPFQYVIM